MKEKSLLQGNDEAWALPCNADTAGDGDGPFGRAMNRLLCRGPPATGMLPQQRQMVSFCH